MTSSMATFPALLALCERNSPITSEFLSQRPVTWSFDVLFDLLLKKRLNKQSRCRWFETPSRSLWRHCYVFGRVYLPMPELRVAVTSKKMKGCQARFTSNGHLLECIILLLPFSLRSNNKPDSKWLPNPYESSLIARFVGPTWGPSGADRTQVGPMLAPWTFRSGLSYLILWNRIAFLSVRIKYHMIDEVNAIKPGIKVDLHAGISVISPSYGI